MGITRTDTALSMIAVSKLALAQEDAGKALEVLNAQQMASQHEVCAPPSIAQLPTKGVRSKEDRAAWLALGFEFEDAGADPLWTKVTACPAGWKTIRTEHPMWSSVVDDRGRKRAVIFYKAAFYDRDAFVHFSGRFRVETVGEYNEPNAARVMDSERVEADLGTHPDHRTAQAAARAWLDEQRPDWKNPHAYWAGVPTEQA